MYPLQEQLNATKALIGDLNALFQDNKIVLFPNLDQTDPKSEIVFAPIRGGVPDQELMVYYNSVLGLFESDTSPMDNTLYGIVKEVCKLIRQHRIGLFTISCSKQVDIEPEFNRPSTLELVQLSAAVIHENDPIPTPVTMPQRTQMYFDLFKPFGIKLQGYCLGQEGIYQLDDSSFKEKRIFKTYFYDPFIETNQDALKREGVKQPLNQEIDLVVTEAILECELDYNLSRSGDYLDLSQLLVRGAHPITKPLFLMDTQWATAFHNPTKDDKQAVRIVPVRISPATEGLLKEQIRSVIIDLHGNTQ